MRRFTLAIAVILLFSSAMLAQHSSGVQNSSGSSSGLSGGGSHGSASSFSSTSGTSHSSGGGSVSPGSTARNSTTSHSGASGSQPYNSHTVFTPDRGVQGKTAQPEKKTFLSFLRHPFRKAEPKTVGDLHVICWKGSCQTCPAGEVRAGRGCAEKTVTENSYDYCSREQIEGGSSCLLQIRFLDECSGFRAALDQQAQRRQEADSAQQGACSPGATQDCSELSSKAQSEANLYHALQERYRQCQLQSYNRFPIGNYVYGSRWPVWLFDPSYVGYFGADIR